MTYSLENLVFRAVGCAVNTAAWAANGLLEVMYPKDIGHIWDDSPREGVEAALADPHPVGVDDAAGVVPPTPAASLTWQGWAVPAVLEVLAEHKPCEREFGDGVYCAGGCGWGQQLPAKQRPDWQEWREHVAPIIADRIACDPQRAVLALTSLQTQ